MAKNGCLNNQNQYIPQLSILICTRNGEKKLQKVINHIAAQENISKHAFDILVVDNASTDRTPEVAANAIEKAGVNGRVLTEPCVGKINAFVKGVYEARGNLISIIDDDNFISPNFVYYTLNIFENYPSVGMTGSSNSILTDRPLPNWFSWTRGRYGCSEPLLEEIEEESSDGILIARTAIIAGAGSTFRATPLLKCLDKGYRFFNDTQRSRDMKVTGEDTELCWLVRSMGYKFACDPRIELHHAVESERLELQEFKLLCKTIGAGSLGCDPFIFTYKYSSKWLPFKWTWQWQLLSKLKRYFYFVLFPGSNGNSTGERRFRNWMSKVECMGAIKRIISERENYTEHIRQVACGKWTELRVR